MGADERHLRELQAKARKFVESHDMKNLDAAELAEGSALAERIERVKADIASAKALAGDGDAADGDDVEGDMYDHLRANGWDGKNFPKVEVPAKTVLYSGRKSDLIATQANANPDRLTGVERMGEDRRYLFPNLPTKDIAVGTTAVQYLRQTTRTLAAVGDMQLSIDSSTDKPVTDSVATLVTEEPIWAATRSNYQPNALFAVPALRDMLNADLALAVRDSVEDKVIDVIRAASGINTRTQGTDTVLDAIFKAKGDLADDGFVGSLVVLPKATFESVSLGKDADDRYYGLQQFAEWGLKVVSSKTLASTVALVIDPAGVDVYLSPFILSVDPYTEMKSNRTQVIAESLVLPAVKQATSICELTLA